ncbi:hypothetical protein [Holospora elegans]|uniref:hypothetical protein n=1 Tax=Holospora elegans TaxID=431043 RepID=UPI00139F2CDC|nr:hypothetical protein [Holospora elegans]
MKVVIDAVDKIHGDVVSGLVEKICSTLWQNSLAETKNRLLRTCSFFSGWGLGRENNAPQSLFLLLLFGCLCLWGP